MSSEVQIYDYMDNKSETESLRLRIREVEDENQELRAQNLIQNRTIIEMRNEIVLMRIQMSEMADTSALLTERVRQLSESVTQSSLRDESEGLITAPPLMAPPPVPPPLPPARIRISPRQVGAGEALSTPLGVSLSCAPRHRIKRDPRQGFYRASRSPYRRFDGSEPGPSTAAQFLASDRPNYFVGLRIIPQFQTSFVCSPNHSSGYSDSASDSSGSDENPQLFKKLKMKVFDADASFKRSSAFSRDFELLKNVRNFHHQKVRQTILHNYNFALPNTNSKFIFPLSRDRKNRDSGTLPSTSGHNSRVFRPLNVSGNDVTPTVSPSALRNPQKLSDSVQYTFPTIHEGLHHNGAQSAVTSSHAGESSRLRKMKNSPYSGTGYSCLSDTKMYMGTTTKTCDREPAGTNNGGSGSNNNNNNNNSNDDDLAVFMAATAVAGKSHGGGSVRCVDSESVSSADETGRRRLSGTRFALDVASDFEQDGFQADESSNCMTSTENSLERINISDSNLQRRDDDERT